MAHKIAWFTSHGRREAFNPTLHPPSFMPSSRKMGSYRGRLEAVAPRELHMPAPETVLCILQVPATVEYLGILAGQRVRG